MQRKYIYLGAGLAFFILIFSVIGAVAINEKPSPKSPELIAAEQKIARQEAELKIKQAAEAQAKEAAWQASPAGKLCAKHTDWQKDDCDTLVENKIWIGMSYDMLVYLRGKPNHANPSNYGSGTHWQWCWSDYTPSCFYGKDDGIITSYN